MAQKTQAKKRYAQNPRKPQAAPKRGVIPWLRDFSGGRMSWRYLAGFFFVLLCVLGMCLPCPFALRYPGSAFDVLGTVKVGGAPKNVITIDGASMHKDSGKLLMTTVSVAGATTVVSNWDMLRTFFDKDAAIVPRELIVPVTTSTEEYEETSKTQMTTAEDTASTIALKYVHGNGLVPGLETDKVKVSIEIGDVGGPSAGLMYTLGIIDELTDAEETGGQTIAGTGTIEDDGSVGAIGGIRQKMVGARDAGATWFLAPSSNCDEVVGHVPDGLRVVSVGDIDDAYTSLVAIGEGAGDSLPTCSAQ
ncbi:MAG: Lon protease [Bifidobacteriaceae bacterium]|nr:Lon protease [Bifidobacteriaceae bacterium]